MVQSSLRDSGLLCLYHPSDESLGYFRLPLRGIVVEGLEFEPGVLEENGNDLGKEIGRGTQCPADVLYQFAHRDKVGWVINEIMKKGRLGPPIPCLEESAFVIGFEQRFDVFTARLEFYEVACDFDVPMPEVFVPHAMKLPDERRR